MLILCPSCATSYQVHPEAIGPDGRLVQCTHCKTMWSAGGPEPGPDTPISAENVFKPVRWFSPPDAEEWKAADQAGTETLVPPDGGEQLVESGELPAEGEGIAPSEEAAAQNDDLEPSEPVSEQSVAVIDTPPLAPPFEDAAPDEPTDEEFNSEVIETFAARQLRLQRRRGKHGRSWGWTAVIVVLLAGNAAALGGRNTLVRTLPQTASLFAAIGLPVNLRQLAFRARQDLEGCERRCADRARRHRQHRRQGDRGPAPAHLRAQCHRAGNLPWTARPSRSVLGAGEQVKFMSQRVSPPPDARDMTVRFFKAQKLSRARAN